MVDRDKVGDRVLIADDQPQVLTSLKMLLRSEGFCIEEANSPEAIIKAISDREFDVLLMDLNYACGQTSGTEGMDLIGQVRRLDEDLPVVVLTAWGTVELVVEAMRRGAQDFLEKPWDNKRLLSVIKTQAALVKTRRESRRLRETNRQLQLDAQVTLIARSAAMQPVLRALQRVAPSDANVLLSGENGTGKNVLAKAIHDASARADRAFVQVNLGTLAESVFESELFGHVRGAFTDAKSDRIGRFELGDGGTIFFDEIANISLPMQARLLWVLETGQYEPVGSSRTRRVDIRIISATNADLSRMIARGAFRADLLYRLNTVEIRLPPLRDRQEDIPLLADHFLEHHARHYGKGPVRFDGSALAAMKSYGWPGNVRELDHVVERAVLMAAGPAIHAQDLGIAGAAAGVHDLESASLEQVESLLIRKAMERFGGNVSKAAEALGLRAPNVMHLSGSDDR